MAALQTIVIGTCWFLLSFKETDKSGETTTVRVAPPDIGFNYQQVMAEHIELMNSGKVAEAIALLEKHVKNRDMIAEAKRDIEAQVIALRDRGGKPDGHELIGFRRLSSRCYTFYVLAYHEKYDMIHFYSFERIQNNWKITNFGFSDRLEQFEANVPYRSLVAPGPK